ncbi:MAG: hypothetical protein Ct9H300mP8_05050 [Gammaproteobacteria bacterium]|nr:MAG: hypothetical protein Ct9H300mP8_05050 [Gammaproteobacteria bacterium]
MDFDVFLTANLGKPHSGVDIAAAQGTPVKSPGPGGLSSSLGISFSTETPSLLIMAAVLSQCFVTYTKGNVQQQQLIEKDLIIGTVGATGRATGPHLPWSVSLQGTRVDPLVFVDVINASANAE